MAFDESRVRLCDLLLDSSLADARRRRTSDLSLRRKANTCHGTSLKRTRLGTVRLHAFFQRAGASRFVKFAMVLSIGAVALAVAACGGAFSGGGSRFSGRNPDWSPDGKRIVFHALVRRIAPATFTVEQVRQPRGLMVTTGGWAYCQQVRALARRTRFTLLCSRYVKDRYLGYGLRSRRHLDWGDPGYLASLATKIQAVHRRVGGELVLIGVSYSGFGIATLASHHPEIHPDRLIVIDSFLNLVARRRAALSLNHKTAREIDAETGGSIGELQARSVTVEGLARIVEAGTRLTVVWSVSPDEDTEFNGATCNRAANAGVLLGLADVLKQPVIGWVTLERHGHALWDHGAAILGGRVPGRQVVFRPRGSIPQGAVCS